MDATTKALALLQKFGPVLANAEKARRLAAEHQRQLAAMAQALARVRKAQRFMEQTGKVTRLAAKHPAKPCEQRTHAPAHRRARPRCWPAAGDGTLFQPRRRFRRP
jgi:hypothetical protein